MLLKAHHTSEINIKKKLFRNIKHVFLEVLIKDLQHVRC
jgi:hypothetical protein